MTKTHQIDSKRCFVTVFDDFNGPLPQPVPRCSLNKIN